MSRLQACFESLRESGRKALVTFITAGDPAPETTVTLMHALVAAGANVLELGVPFSDPMADGPVIQRASERALAGGMTLARTLAMVAEFRTRDSDTPVVLMGYLNPFEAMGYRAFADAAHEAGVDGVITVDLPPEEAEDFAPTLRAAEIDPIFLLAPTSDADRIRRVSAQASGFLYYVSLKGVTGAASLDVAQVAEKVAQIKQHTGLPVGVGFGIHDADSARRVAAVADAVVVGSVLVEVCEQGGDSQTIAAGLSAQVSAMREAMDAGSDTG